MDAARLEKKIKQIVKGYMDDAGWFNYSATGLTREGAREFIKQWGVFTRNSRQAWASVVANCPEVEVRRFIVRENLYEEEGIEAQSHFLMLADAGIAVGLTMEEIMNAKALPSTRAAMLVWETLTKNRHWMIGCAAKLCLELPSDPECGNASAKQHELWMSKLGLTEHQARFFSKHDELDQVHGSGAFGLLVKYLAKQNVVTENDIIQAVEESFFAFKIYLDGLEEAAIAAEAAAAAAAAKGGRSAVAA